MIRTKTTIAGTEFFDYTNLEISNAQSDNNTASNFIIQYDSPYGRHSSDFSVGQQIKVYADKDTAPVTNIFTGIIELVEFKGDGIDQRVELRGRDYGARLMDSTVQPTIYTNTEVGSIVRDILKNNTQDIGSVNVQTTPTTLQRIVFNQIPVFNAIKQLADLSNYSFYVDNNQDLHFEPAGSASAGINLGSQNIKTITFDKTREGMANKIWVYGDRYTTQAPTIVFSVGSPAVIVGGGSQVGSVFTVNYPPYNTQVSTSLTAGSFLIGGILNQTSSSSGTGYLVSQNDSQIILRSGTSLGYNTIPASGGSVVVAYDRSIPVIKYGENKQSINLYGPKTLVITDKSITDPNTAIRILNDQINNANPLQNLSINLNGWSTPTPNQTVNVNIPNFNIIENGIPIVEVRYKFDANTVNEETPITLKLDTKQLTLTDQIRNLNNRLIALESSDKLKSETYTRLQYATGSLLVVGSYWSVRSTWGTGSEFRAWAPNQPSIASGGMNRLGLAWPSAGNKSYIYDDTVNYSGTYTNIFTSGAGGQGGAPGTGSALVCSGLQVYSVTTDNNLNFTSSGAFTFSAWNFPISGTTAAGDVQGIVGKAYNYGLDYSPNIGSYRFGVRSGTASIITNFALVYSQWNHVVGIYDNIGSTIQIFVNGSSNTALSTGGSVFNSANTTLNFGKGMVLGGDSFSGLEYIDEVRIYNRALSASEVSGLYNFGDIRSGLVAYWSFDNGSGFNMPIGSRSYLASGTLTTNAQIMASGGYFGVTQPTKHIFGGGGFV